VQTYIKISDDDAFFLGENSPEKVIDELLKMGAKCVCMTLGAKGSIIATADSDQRFFCQQKQKIKGAGPCGAGNSLGPNSNHSSTGRTGCVDGWTVGLLLT
jgi:sugar/nucleoside kinase (ribokinase family)